MEMRSFGKTGMRVSALGFGAGGIGYAECAVDTLLGVAQDYGINIVDTAAMYGDSEEKLGRALQGKRDQFLIFTKCGRLLPPKDSYSGFWVRTQRKLRTAMGRPEIYESLDWHPLALQWNIDQSLRRLRTDRIDLIQLHSCSVETLRRNDVIEVLHRARRAGKVLHVGYSGDGAAACYAIESGEFEAVQISINIADQDALEQVLPLARRYDIGVIAKRPIANGTWRSPLAPLVPKDRAYWERLRKLHYDFLKGECAFSIALQFTLSVAGVHTAVIGTTDPEHLRINARCAEAGRLDEHEFDSIRAYWRRIAESDWVGQM